jgi:hypothetical protein
VERGWKHIAPIFGDLAPNTATLEHIDGWYHALKATTSVAEAAVELADEARKRGPLADQGEGWEKVETLRPGELKPTGKGPAK